MTWQTPHCTEISMNAEIGAYQQDRDPDTDPVFEREYVAPAQASPPLHEQEP
jgi:hypothetical protein